VFSGVNVENASYPLSVCAERNCIATAVAVEGSGMRIETIAVWADAAVATPCGGCRQVILEFSSDTRLLFLRDGRYVVRSMDDLLPERYVLRRS
jgi:cytidine deaminase